MYIPIAIITATLSWSNIAAALALPAHLSSPRLARRFNPLPDDPDMTPIDLLDITSETTMTCGSMTFNYDDIYKAIQWSDILEQENMGRGQKSKKFPKGRFPHDFDDDDFSFSDHCPPDNNRQEYPLIADGPYNGGISGNKEWGNHRVIHYNKGEVAADGNPINYFCGGVTHEGAETSADFVLCTVNN